VELPANACREMAIAALESVISALHVRCDLNVLSFPHCLFLQAANEDLVAALTNFSNLGIQQLNSIYSSDIHFIANTLSQSTLEKILSCLASVQFSNEEEKVDGVKPVTVTYDQYVALLEIYQDDPQLKSLLMNLLSNQQQTLFSKSHLPLLKFIRFIGTENLTFCSLFCHPILSSVYSMESEINSFSCEGKEEGAGSEGKKDLYDTSMKLLDALDKIQQHKKSNSSAAAEMFGFQQESEDDESGDTLQIMCVLDEIFGKEEDEDFRNKNQSVVYQNEQIPIRIRSSLLVERSVDELHDLLVRLIFGLGHPVELSFKN
jgi:hypothetical protein